MLIDKESLHDEFIKLIQNIYCSINFENANFIKVSELINVFEGKLLELSKNKPIQIITDENVELKL